jgi:hypothetical protein
MSKAWVTLSKIDCSKHVEKKGQLSYLSWSWAWSTLMNEFPSSTFEIHSDERLPDDSVMVSCTVTVEGMPRTMWLPVMDNKNNAIKSPDARKISDARMRCLVKCIAMHGLGLYIYAGEDLPETDPPVMTDADFKALNDLLDESGADKEAFCKAFGIKSVKDLPLNQLAKATSMLHAKIKAKESANA